MTKRGVSEIIDLTKRLCAFQHPQINYIFYTPNSGDIVFRCNISSQKMRALCALVKSRLDPKVGGELNA